MALYEYDPPDRFVAGTVGQPGERTFFLQASGHGAVTSVALEKQQVAVLAERIDELLDEVVRRSGGEAPVPALAPVELMDDAPLAVPVDEDFRVGTMSLAWDGEAERVVIECLEVGEDASEVDDAGDLSPQPGAGLLRVSLTGASARAFAKRASAVVAAGRPPCPFCGNPLDPEGHVCPRANGHRR
ncbi:MAG TPA: DUF3090 domain-containing protein [Actinomycetales bacterium]|nr:DUF3090 domain-containing protein [Actinomycetales bacterium]